MTLTHLSNIEEIKIGTQPLDQVALHGSPSDRNRFVVEVFLETSKSARATTTEICVLDYVCEH